MNWNLKSSFRIVRIADCVRVDFLGKPFFKRFKFRRSIGHQSLHLIPTIRVDRLGMDFCHVTVILFRAHFDIWYLNQR